MSSHHTPLHQHSLSELSHLLQTRKISSVELTQHYLQRMSIAQELHAFLAVDEEITLNQAKEADKRLAAGQTDPLLGIPIAHKDLFVTRDFISTAASKMLSGYRSPFDATVVSRLAKAGAVTLGKLSCDEFAMGSGNENVSIPSSGNLLAKPVLNPWHKEYVPGGSSGGSAAAVAADLCAAATGTDTGGSIRQPAAFCSVTGIKPTYGRVSRYGMIAFASSLDQAGVLAHSAADCALLLSAMVGADSEHDSTTLDLPSENFSLKLTNSIEGLRIGVPKEFFTEGLAEEVRLSIETTLKQYEELGVKLVPISLPRTQLAIPVYYIIAAAEASSNLSRYDGVKFGHRAKEYRDLDEMYIKSRMEGFGEEVKRRIMLGTYVLSHGYYDAYYLQALKIRRLIAQEFKEAFLQCDVIAAPVTPTVAWKIGAKNDNPLSNYLEDIYTLPASLAGLPGMSIPVGFASGLPIGMQLIGNYLQESRLLNIAHRFQMSSDVHHQRPSFIIDSKDAQ